MNERWIVRNTRPDSCRTKLWLVRLTHDGIYVWSEQPSAAEICIWPSKDDADRWLLEQLLGDDEEYDPVETVLWEPGQELRNDP